MAPSRPTAIADLLGLADEAGWTRFIEALVDGDVLGGHRHPRCASRPRAATSWPSASSSWRASVSVLVARLASASGEQRAEARALAGAARRLTGIDASRSGLGGYRWQLELCLLAAAEAPPAPCGGPCGGLTRPVPRAPPRPVRGAAPPATGARASRPRLRPTPGPLTRGPPRGRPSAQARVDAAVGRTRPAAAADGADVTAEPTSPAAGRRARGDDLDAIRASWPQIVATIGRNPANRPLVATCRPVDMRDGVLVLGFPEDQAFLRDIAERKRLVLEDGIAPSSGRPVAVRCVVTNLELVAAVDAGEGDLVAQAQRIFDGELVGVEDIDVGEGATSVNMGNLAKHGPADAGRHGPRRAGAA